jgi:competence protein ComEC
VTSLELVVLTHVHADHATGLAGIVDRMPIGRIWHAPGAHESSAATEFIAKAETMGIPVERPEPGGTYGLGLLDLVVEGPVRPYASPNDESIVLTVTGPARSALLSGDIETVAQSDLDHLRSEVLKVPHQGAGTSDPDWLASVGAELAVISVGPNQFGHPVGWVIETLRASGAEVVRTDQAGDVAIPLG